MIPRQRKRALNIIRCYNNVRVLNLVKSEQAKIDQLKQELKFVNEPKFISYIHGELHVIDGLTKDQTIKIELETLLLAMNRVEVNLGEYNSRLDNLIERLGRIPYKNNYPN